MWLINEQGSSPHTVQSRPLSTGTLKFQTSPPPSFFFSLITAYGLLLGLGSFLVFSQVSHSPNTWVSVWDLSRKHWLLQHRRSILITAWPHEGPTTHSFKREGSQVHVFLPILGVMARVHYQILQKCKFLVCFLLKKVVFINQSNKKAWPFPVICCRFAANLLWWRNFSQTT